ncbi:MAG: CotH kinase family protein, partial [Planctomycetes bacterium]|nr:CotH kinase family protein [Planctomycetota bacterium]
MQRAPLITIAIATLVACVSGLICAQSNDAPPTRKTTVHKLTIDALFPTDRVLDVRITVAEEDWNTIRHQSRTFQTALHADRKYGPLDHPYTYVNASVTIDGVSFLKVGLRKKGFIGSQSAVRPSLKIKLNHVDAAGQIDGLTNLTFNNSQQDGSMLSQFMGYAFFNAVGSPAPRCAYAQITVNGRHLGVYAHVESARRPLARRGFGDDSGTFYEGTVVDFFEGWDGSFERKFGKDEPGRQKIKQLTKALQGDVGKLVLCGDAMGHGWVTTGDQHN